MESWFTNKGQVLQVIAASITAVLALVAYFAVPVNQLVYVAPVVFLVLVGWVTVVFWQAFSGAGGTMRTVLATIVGLAIVVAVFFAGWALGLDFHAKGGMLIMDGRRLGPPPLRPVVLCNYTLVSGYPPNYGPRNFRGQLSNDFKSGGGSGFTTGGGAAYAGGSSSGGYTGGVGTGVTGGVGTGVTGGQGEGPNSGGGLGPNGGGFGRSAPPSGTAQPLPPSGTAQPLPPSGYIQPPPPSGVMQPPSNTTPTGDSSNSTPSGNTFNSTPSGNTFNSAPTGSSGEDITVHGGCQRWTDLGFILIVWPR